MSTCIGIQAALDYFSSYHVSPNTNCPVQGSNLSGLTNVISAETWYKFHVSELLSLVAAIIIVVDFGRGGLSGRPK
jgi:hypothetical protein